MAVLRHFTVLLSLGMVCLLPQGADAKPIREEMFVPIGGIQQWITIHGRDSANPVLLVLHGGPGDPLSPYADSLFTGWDKDFTLVQWDQRGAGRTYGKTGPAIEATMTMDRMTQDGIEVAEYLKRHLGKSKIILMGGSWGSILGITMAHARPDLFYAYIGQSQVVNWRKTTSLSYALVLRMAEAAKDKDTITALNSIGAPPWKTFMPAWAVYHKAMLTYQAKGVTAPDAPLRISKAYDAPAERAQYSEAEDFSQFHFFAGKEPKTKADLATLPLAGPINDVDLPALGTEFQIPIHIVDGAADLTAPPELAKTYLNSIKAPAKSFTLVPGSGHNPSMPMMVAAHKILLEQVKPLAK